MTKKAAVAGSLLLGAFAAAAMQVGADWPVFRGNPRQTGVATTPLPDNLAVLWKFEVKKPENGSGDNAFEGTAAIADGVVFVGCQDEHVYAVNLADGKLKWKYKASAPIKVGAAWNGGLVYIGDEDGKFHCIDAATGAKRWIFDTDAEITSAANFDGDRVLFGAGDSLLYCLDKDKGGQPLWTFKVPGGPVMGTPAIIDSKTFVAGCDSMLHVIDTKTGKELNGVELEGQVAATPALVGDVLYVGTMTNQIQAIDWKAGKVVWTYEAKKKQQPFAGAVAATKDLIIGGSRDRCIHAVDVKSGTEKWVFPTGGRVDSSPVVAGQRVYGGSSDSKLYVLDLANGKELQALALGTRGILASPAVSNGRLVIGTVDGALVCLGKKE
jgi:outer membrane protein assembly factor BamB